MLFLFQSVILFYILFSCYDQVALSFSFMFRLCQRWQARYLVGQQRGFHLSPILFKRVTRGTIHNVFDRSSLRQERPLPLSKLSNANPSTPLEPRLACTGSVVLDAVREYTRQYPDCVLLMQVGDFYEVSIYLYTCSILKDKGSLAI